MLGITRIEVSEEIALVTFRKIPCNLPLISNIFKAIAKRNIVIDMISQTSPAGENVTLSFTCQEKNLLDILEVANELNIKYPQVKPMIASSNCKIQLYGEEMRNAYGVFANALAAIEHINMELLQVTTSEVDISLLISTVNRDQAVAALKSCFSIK